MVKSMSLVEYLLEDTGSDEGREFNFEERKKALRTILLTFTLEVDKAKTEKDLIRVTGKLSKTERLFNIKTHGLKLDQATSSVMENIKLHGWSGLERGVTMGLLLSIPIITTMGASGYMIGLGSGIITSGVQEIKKKNLKFFL